MTGLDTAYFKSPIGIIEIKFSDKGIVSLNFIRARHINYTIHSLSNFQKQLEEYFSGKRKKFNLDLDMHGTEFQKRVWNEVIKIPFGVTTTYANIAKNIDNPGALRAVGNANGKNPIAIIVPCHRVIGTDGNLTGYAGGLWRKKWLLEHEHKFKQLRLFHDEKGLNHD